eukprot:5957363-Amphidinium_carterae.5
MSFKRNLQGERVQIDSLQTWRRLSEVQGVTSSQISTPSLHVTALASTPVELGLVTRLIVL